MDQSHAGAQPKSVAPPPTDLQKRPPEDDWERGHHHFKSTRQTYASVAPQMPQSQSRPPEEEWAAARASQKNLLNIVNTFLRSGYNTISSSNNPADGSSGDETTDSEQRDRTPVAWSERSGSRVRISEPPTPCGSTPRPNEPFSRESTSVSFASAESRNGTPRPSVETPGPQNVTANDQASSKRKGKQKTKESAPRRGEHFDFSTLDIPSWPDSSQGPSTSLVFGPTPVFPLTSNCGSSHSNNIPRGNAGFGFGQLLSHFSEGMDRLLSSVQRHQTTSEEAMLKRIDLAMGDLKTSLAGATSTSATATPATPAQNSQQSSNVSEQVLGFPPVIRRRAAKTRKHFIPSKETSEPLDVEEHKVVMSCIRFHSLNLLRIRDYKYLYTIKCSLTDDEVQAFELEEMDAIEITPANFMINCLGGIQSAFNKTAAIVFAEDFLDKVNNHDWYSEKIPLRYRKPHIIAQAFQSHLAHIKSRYRQVVVEPRNDPLRAKERNDARLQKSSRGSRKTRLLKLRLDAMAGHPDLCKHIPLVQYLGAQVISSDESEDEVRRTINYPRVYPRWRSDRLAALMWQADVVMEETFSVPLGTRKKAGGLLRSRPHSTKFNDDAPAPIGLPRNCYSSEWLVKLPPRVLKRLQAVDQDYDFDPSNPEPSGSASSNSAQQPSNFPDKNVGSSGSAPSISSTQPVSSSSLNHTEQSGFRSNVRAPSPMQVTPSTFALGSGSVPSPNSVTAGGPITHSDPSTQLTVPAPSPMQISASTILSSSTSNSAVDHMTVDMD